MILYAVTIFISAFLLFVVQPIAGKYVLPWFGGTPAVWTSCMLFFQTILLAGYSYAHWIAGKLSSRNQVRLHMTLLVAALASLPIIPSASWNNAGTGWPVGRILGLLLVTLGAPYFLLSTTGPLLQAWFSRCRPDRSPYRLYSLSNFGSLLAIACYPFLIEPALSLHFQAQIWSWGFALFTGLCGLCAWGLLRQSPPREPAGPTNLEAQSSTVLPPAGKPQRVLWLALAACGSVMLLATTNQLCQDVAVIPLLWVLPLALYLLTFIICFHHDRWYSRPLFVALVSAALAQSCIVLYGGVFVDLRLQIASYSFTLFVCCMFCHGELVRLKPGARDLTAYYLMISAGGALGALLVGIVAPVLFKSYWEYHLVLLATAILMLVVLARKGADGQGSGRPLWLWTALGSGLVILTIALGVHIRNGLRDSIETTRNFFGVLRVLEEDRTDSQKHCFTLMHNRITHGYQFVDREKRYWPTSYFGPDSGVGLAIRYHPNRRERNSESPGMRIGVVGLGAGTIATYGEQGDYIRFYEINPEVVRLSGKYFTYRRDTDARVDIVLGDARVSMERERAQHQSQQFDVLAIDAFTGDAIPVHLLTRECFETYLYHLRKDGILAIHVSSRYFDLTPVVQGLAALDQENGMTAVRILNIASHGQATESSDWALLTCNRALFRADEVQYSITPWPNTLAPVLWTDDYSNLLHLLRTEKEK